MGDGGGAQEGEPNVELAPILFPYLPKSDRECQIYSEYLECLAILKTRTTLPVITGPIKDTFEFFGLDLAKDGEGKKVSGAVRILHAQCKTYWGGEENKKIRAIFLGTLGN